MRRLLKQKTAGSQDDDASAITNFGQYQNSFLSLWRLTLGDVDYVELERSHSHVQVTILSFTLPSYHPPPGDHPVVLLHPLR